MVKGIDIFKKYFASDPENYVIIGGTACDILIEEAGFVPRATKFSAVNKYISSPNTYK